MEEQEKFYTTSKNPVLYPNIIHQILKSCDTRTLKYCRLVCKIWEDEVNRFCIVKKCPIVISHDTSNNFRGKQISNNVIIDRNVGPESSSVIESALHYSQICSKVQFLEIQSGPWSGSQLFEILSNLPHLQELTLSQNFILPKKVDHHHQDSHKINLDTLHSLHLNLSDQYLQNFANCEFLIDFCQSTPNLRRITCDRNKFCEPGHPNTTIFAKLLFRTVLNIFKSDDISSSNLTHLDINVDLRDEDIDLIINANLPLNYIHLPLNSHICSQKVNILLSHLSHTLTKLKITFGNSACKLPVLESIRHLKSFAVHRTSSEMMGPDNRTRYRRRSSFGIGFGEDSKKQSLYKFTDIDLDLDQTIYYIFHVIPVTLFPYCDETLPTPLLDLTELHLNAVYYIPKDVSNLNTFFPNLSHLKMSFLDDNLLQCVIKSFPRLESLGATEGFFTDTILTGISPEVQDIFKNVKVSQAYNIECLREFVSILSLSNLKTLELGSPRVTSFGVINGVSMCHSVQEFNLNFPQMDDNSLLSFAQNSNWDSLIVKGDSFSHKTIQHMKNGASHWRKFECCTE